jgi:hypothetical protein
MQRQIHANRYVFNEFDSEFVAGGAPDRSSLPNVTQVRELESHRLQTYAEFLGSDLQDFLIEYINGSRGRERETLVRKHFYAHTPKATSGNAESGTPWTLEEILALAHLRLTFTLPTQIFTPQINRFHLAGESNSGQTLRRIM